MIRKTGYLSHRSTFKTTARLIQAVVFVLLGTVILNMAGSGCTRPVLAAVVTADVPRDQVYLFPNPVYAGHAAVAVYCPASGNVLIRIYTESMALALEQSNEITAGRQNISLNLTDFAAGVYFYQVILKTDDGLGRSFSFKKFVVHP